MTPTGALRPPGCRSIPARASASRWRRSPASSTTSRSCAPGRQPRQGQVAARARGCRGGRPRGRRPRPWLRWRRTRAGCRYPQPPGRRERICVRASASAGVAVMGAGVFPTTGKLWRLGLAVSSMHSRTRERDWRQRSHASHRGMVALRRRRGPAWPVIASRSRPRGGPVKAQVRDCEIQGAVSVLLRPASNPAPCGGPP